MGCQSRKDLPELQAEGGDCPSPHHPSSTAAQRRQRLHLPRASEPVLRTASECRPVLGFHIWLLGPHTGTGWAGFLGIQQVALPSGLRAASGSLERPGCPGWGPAGPKHSGQAPGRLLPAIATLKALGPPVLIGQGLGVATVPSFPLCPEAAWGEGDRWGRQVENWASELMAKAPSGAGVGALAYKAPGACRGGLRRHHGRL